MVFDAVLGDDEIGIERLSDKALEAFHALAVTDGSVASLVNTANWHALFGQNLFQEPDYFIL